MSSVRGSARLVVVVAMVVLSALFLPLWRSLARAVDQPENGTLVVRAILIDDDLSLRPVPKKVFLITPAEGGSEPQEATTDFDGKLTLALPPGDYRLTSDTPVEFQDNAYAWDVPFVVEGGAETIVELSNHNATVRPSGSASAGELDEGALFERYRAGVFKVISDGGHGSGFLIDDAGLILTNHHVISEAEYLAVKLDDTRKHTVELLAEDPKYDLAVLRVHPSVIDGLPVLPLADDTLERPAVEVGDDVLAIGSPLTTETILTGGLVSKVEDDALFSDVNINPGNSGGPLLSSRGVVVGVNTFRVGMEGGSGLSGITRIHVAEAVIAQARAAFLGQSPPDPKPLLVESTYRLSPEIVRDMALQRRPETDEYHLEFGKIDVHFFTPVLMAYNVVRFEREALEGRKKRRKKKGTDDDYTPGNQFYEWTKNSDNFRPVVQVHADPEIKMKAGSAWRAAFVGGPAAYKFKTDFQRMELTRDGELVTPVHPGRVKNVVHIESAAVMKDVGYWGYYEYRPEAFRPGATVVLSIWEQGESEPTVREIPVKMLETIWADYASYAETLEN